MHGKTPGGFTVGELTPAQYSSLGELASNYFEARHRLRCPSRPKTISSSIARWNT
jgi:hypothetical protein